MTPREAFDIANRYQVEKRMGLTPSPLKIIPDLDKELYLPGFFLWMCLGLEMNETTFKRTILRSPKIKKTGTDESGLSYQVGSCLEVLQKCYRPQRRTQAKRPIDLASAELGAIIRKQKEKTKCLT